MAKRIIPDNEARKRVLEGAEELYKAVKVTMGPKGRRSEERRVGKEC